MALILSREGAALRVSVSVFKAVVQTVLLFGSDTWVVTPHMGKALGGVSNHCGDTVYGTAPTEDDGHELDIHLGGNGKGGGMVLDDEEKHLAAVEHIRTVHLYTITGRNVLGVGKGTGGGSRDAVVRTGRTSSGGGVGSGRVGGVKGWGIRVT